ncbi:MAG TPA: heme-binding protein [Thermomicrobiales bacterium]|jgi:uncharacterized protein GlcG (DUF336 family)|nr:heme-binding protein [Thermomicrobiales bacterium]
MATNGFGQELTRRNAVRAGVALGAAAAIARGTDAAFAQQATPQAGADTTMRATLTLDGALRMIEAARAKATELNVPMVIVVVDDSGLLKAFVRMDGAGVGSIDLATGKAYTAAAFRTPTDQLAARAAQDPARLATFTNSPQVRLLPGGLPIKIGDAVAGGLGAGGGTPDQDLQVAQAGVAAVASA